MSFDYRVTCGWLRDLASEPAAHETWPSIRWDEQLLADQVRFLDVMAEVGVEVNLAWGLFIDRSWPTSLVNVIDAGREARLHAFVQAAHERKLKIISGVGVYSWGFDEIIAQDPSLSPGTQKHAMCAFSEQAWDWQRRVLDFLMDPRWGLDGLSMQSADQGRCDCPQCAALSPIAHHAKILIRSAEHVRKNRPDWLIGQASWGLRVEDPGEFEHLQAISKTVDYMIEVNELSAAKGRRQEMAGQLHCAFGSVGGVFVEPPQHWDRLRWFVPCGLRSARALAKLWSQGGRASEYYYRPFANPVEEISWRTGARMLSSPQAVPEESLREAVAQVYGAQDDTLDALAEWFSRGEEAYFSRSNYVVGSGPLSLEPLWWPINPAAPGPAIYLCERMTAKGRADYARELEGLRAELVELGKQIPNSQALARTLSAIDGTLSDIAGG